MRSRVEIENCPVNLLHIFWTPFPRNTSGRLLLILPMQNWPMGKRSHLQPSTIIVKSLSSNFYLKYLITLKTRNSKTTETNFFLMFLEALTLFRFIISNFIMEFDSRTLIIFTMRRWRLGYIWTVSCNKDNIKNEFSRFMDSL